MTARDLISETLPPLKMTDTGNRALAWMTDFQVRHLPLVDDGQFMGLLTEDDIYDFNNPDKMLGEHTFSLRKPTVKPAEHIYEVIKTAVNLQLTVIPVVENEEYLGVITLDNILKYFAQTGAMIEPGTILEVEIPRRDYSLTQVAQIVESESAKVLSTYVTSPTDSEVIRLTIKLNIQNPERIIASFTRYNYVVKAHYQEAEYIDTLKERYDALMSYLNV